MKKWYLFSMPLSLILAFVAVPLVQIVYANGNISGTARLRLVTSYVSMSSGGTKVDCDQNGSKRCLILSYNIAGINPASRVKVGLHKDNCQGALKEKLEINNIPVGDGRDGRAIIAKVDFTKIPRQQLFYCIFSVQGSKDTVIGQGKFDIAPNQLTAKTTVAPA